MKKVLKSTLAMFMAIVMMLGVLPLSGFDSFNFIVEANAAFENTWTNTGDQAKDIVEVAKTQLEYVEGSGNNNKYGAAFNHNYVDWCAYFVSWCAKEAGIPDNIIHQQGRASPFSGYFNIPNTHGRSNYFPKPGDLIFYGPNSNGDHYHVGIVETVNSSTGYITTIEGNSGSSANGVYRHNLHYQYSSICCYGIPNYDMNKEPYVNLGDDFYAVILNYDYWKPITLDDDKQVRLREETGSANQVWRFQRQNDESYVISSAQTGKVLELSDGNNVENNPVSAPSDYWGGAYQRWYIYENSSGGYFLESYHYTSEGWYLTLDNNNPEDGTAITTCKLTGNPKQIWAIYSQDEVQLKAPVLTVKAGTSSEETVFLWDSVYGSTSYDVKIRKDAVDHNVSSYHTEWNTKSGYSILLPPGTYEAYVCSNNHYEAIGSKFVSFTVTTDTYQVSYDNNGGSGAPAAQNKTYGTNLTLSTTKPTRTGYTFKGWNTKADGSGTSYASGASYTENAEITLFAQWEANTYTATFYANGGKWSDGSTFRNVPTDFDSQIEAPEEPTRQGYIFSVWTPQLGVMDDINGKEFNAVWIASTDTHYTVETFTMNTLGEYVKSSQVLAGTTDSTVNAEYTVAEGFTLNEEKSILSGNVEADNSLVLKVYLDRNTYSVTTIVDGFSESKNYLYGSTIAEPATPNKIGYTFAGWTPEIPTSMPKENLVFTATWKANSYGAVFNANGGAWSGGETTKTVATDFDSEIIAPESPSRQGYDFAGWDSEIGIMDTEGKTFTAQWTARNDAKYTVETYTMNTAGEYDKVAVKFNGTTDESITLNPDVSTGFTLNFGKSVLKGTVSGNNSLVLKVYLDRNKYTITKIVDGAATETEYLYGSIIAEPATPVKTGYTFVNWTPEIPTVMPAEDFTITAQFTVNSYDAIFNANGGKWSDGTIQKTVKTDFDSQIVAPEEPTRQGYIFSVWTPQLGVMDDINGKVFNAVWIASTDTHYTVETFTMNTLGEYVKSSQVLAGTTDSVVNAEYTVAEGFTLNKEKSILSGNVEADNSLVLKVYLDRNKYKFTNVVDGEATDTEYLYGSIIEKPATPVKTGYSFTGWDKIIPATMPAEDYNVTAQFTVNSYDAVFNANGGAWYDEASTKTITTDFDSEIVAPENPSRQGYDFAGWDSEIGIMDDVNGKTFSAKWTARNDTVYTVETYTMDIYGKYSVVKETKKGTTDTEATVTANAQPGFAFNNAKSNLSGNIAADGSLVLSIYYDRNIYTFTTVVEGKATSSSYYFDAPVTMPANPVKSGYKFTGWDNAIPAKMPANDVTVTANFELSFKMSIRNPSTTTIKYGDKIILHADMNEALPNGWTIKWTADNSDFSYSVSADGTTCTVSPKSSGKTVFTATIYDEDGNAISTDTQEMTAKAGFFDKIVAFFRKIFGLTKTIPEAFKGIF